MKIAEVYGAIPENIAKQCQDLGCILLDKQRRQPTCSVEALIDGQRTRKSATGAYQRFIPEECPQFSGEVTTSE